MMWKNIILMVICIFIVANPCWSSVVVLKNGDRISGEIIEDNDGLIKMVTELLGEILIKKENVVSIVLEGEKNSLDQALVVSKKEEKVQIKAPVYKAWKHKLSAGYITSNGNTRTSSANVSLNSYYKKERNEWKIKNSLDYASEHGRMTTQKFYSKSQSDYRLKENSPWFNTRSLEVSHDKFAHIDYRVLPSIGIGYWFWEEEYSKSEFDLGLGYEYTNFNTTDTKSSGNFTLIPHFYFDKVIFGKTKISEDLTLYPSLDSFANYRLRSETSLVNPLSDVLSLKLSFIDEYNSNPNGKAKKNDTTFMSSIQYAF